MIINNLYWLNSVWVVVIVIINCLLIPFQHIIIVATVVVVALLFLVGEVGDSCHGVCKGPQQQFKLRRTVTPSSTPTHVHMYFCKHID